MISHPDCQKYYEQKYASIGQIHPLIMAAEFLPRFHTRDALTDWERLTKLAEQHQWVLSADWKPAVSGPKTALIVTDSLERIAWINRGFTQMTGYSMAQAVGRNPKFLQGEDTNQLARQQIRQHLRQRLTYSGTLLNYRQNGQPYWCRISIHPLCNASGELMHFLAIENEEKAEAFLE